MNHKLFSATLLIAGLVMAMAISSPAQTAFGKSKKQTDLTGTWLVNIHFNLGDAAANPAAGKFLRMARTHTPASPAETTAVPLDTAPTQAPFNTLFTFHSEGTFAENSQIDFLPPPGTPGRGLWEKISNSEFSVTGYGVLIDGFDTAGFAGTYRERARLLVNGSADQFTGTALVEIFDAAGNFVFSFDGTYEGRRATLLPAP